ncbi:MAG: helix-turn-helix transcriptional regulator [Saprospiraceae bacterium]|nr:helix-turn-helix transcriptional regulator [Saprospiraceae bacterium]
MLDTELPEKIRTIRRFLHLTQQEMAEQLEISAEAYGKIERGKTRIHLIRLQQISAIFGVEVSLLMEKNAKDLVQNLMLHPSKKQE